LKITPLILAGGQGSRLWPVSTPELPKQFLPLKMGGTAFSNTLQRVSDKEIFEAPIIICAEQHKKFIQDSTNNIEADIISEPMGKNTAPACAIGALAAKTLRGNDSILLILPSDHYIPDISLFEQAVLDARHHVQSGHIICLGIEPEFGHTEFGYIELGHDIGADSFRVKSFTEKPNLDLANKYLKSGGYVWNTGIYFVKSSVMIEEMTKFQPDIILLAKQAWENSIIDEDCYMLDPNSFSTCPKTSIDYAVMEHTEKASVQIVDFEWRDLGGWDALMEFDISS
jgi:mannose-1-phosphate guanylyltransferase/mannose-6-phosphate isomerase